MMSAHISLRRRKYLSYIFSTTTNKYTINSQIITLLLYVSPLMCHPLGASNQYLAK
jgi:hypothetical protein